MDNKVIEISSETEKLLQALKSLENAHQLYFEFLLERGGESFAEQTAKAHADTWRAAANILKTEINYSVEVWATGGRDQI